MKSSLSEYLDIALLVCFATAFFIISSNGYYCSDDVVMGFGAFSSLKDVVSHTKTFYMNLGGRFFSVAANYLFCGLLKNKLWFDIVNTLFFVFFVWVCGKLIRDDGRGQVQPMLVFTLLFWFLCPVPSQTLFWVAGATTHMWANALAFLYLWLFLKHKDEDFPFLKKLGVFFLSVICAAEFIPCASICGALVVYYAFHLKSFKKNAVPFVIGFVLGSILVLFAPGNYIRAIDEIVPFTERIKGVFLHPVTEIVKYKALWLFLFLLLFVFIRNKVATKAWIKNNTVLLLALGWSVVAFSVVFRPADRALFFPEVLSLILSLRLVYDHFSATAHTGRLSRIEPHRALVRTLVMVVLFTAFIWDAVAANTETKIQRSNNSAQLKQIAASNGIVALDRIRSSHRMAYAPVFPEGTWEPLAYTFGLDSVRIYPHYCQDKFYGPDAPFENAFIEDNYEDDDVFGKYACLTVRIKDEALSMKGDRAVIRIDYTRPHKWYKNWLDKRRNYQYDRTAVIERDQPDECFNGYHYYVIWMKKENLDNCRNVEITVKQVTP